MPTKKLSQSKSQKPAKKQSKNLPAVNADQVEKNKGGRPTIYSTEYAHRICDLIATSPGIGVTKLCVDYDWMPNEDTIYDWRNKNKEFSEMFWEAKKRQLLLHAEKAQELARKTLDMKFFDPQGNEKIDPGAVAAYKLILDTDKWMYERVLPTVFGLKTHTTLDVNTHETRLKDLK